METEQPILERFGYPRGTEGAYKMEKDLVQACIGLDSSAEIVRNNELLGDLLHRFDPPPQELLEMRQLEFVILGTEDGIGGPPECVRLEVPQKASCGLARFILCERFGGALGTGTLKDEVARLVSVCDGMPTVHMDSDPVPAERVLVAGVGDRWPALPAPDADSGEEWLISWRLVNRWLQDKEAQRRVSTFKSSVFKIAGSWDNFQHNDMFWDGHCFTYLVSMSEQRWLSFQILLDGSWEKTLHPDIRDASPWVRHKLEGPDNRGHGKNWTIGRHADDKGEPGTTYKVELSADDFGRPGSVSWKRLAEHEAERAVDAWTTQARIGSKALREEENSGLLQLRAAETAKLVAERDQRRLQRLMLRPEASSGPLAAAQFDFDALEALEELRRKEGTS